MSFFIGDVEVESVKERAERIKKSIILFFLGFMAVAVSVGVMAFYFVRAGV